MKEFALGLLLLAAFFLPALALSLIWPPLPAFVALGALVGVIAYLIGLTYLDERRHKDG